MANGETKKPSFHSNFKIVNLIFVKSTPKNVLAEKLLCQLKSQIKKIWGGKTLFGCTFYYGQMYIFEISLCFIKQFFINRSSIFIAFPNFMPDICATKSLVPTVTRLIRSGIGYWRPGKFLFFILMIQSHERSIKPLTVA
jgi:hypothetical protein